MSVVPAVLGKTTLAAGTAVLALLGCMVLWWAHGDTSPVPTTTALAPAASPVATSLLRAQPETVGDSAAVGFLNVPGGADAKVPGRDPLLSADLIRVFDQILSRCTARDKAGLLAQALALLPQHVPPAWLARAQALLVRYLDYREAASAIAAPDGNDPKSLRRVFEARAKARAKYFAAEELAGLFGAEDRFDRFSLDRLELMRNPDLTPEQRAKAIQQAEQEWLSPEQRDQRQQFTAHQVVDQMTQDMAQRGLTDAQAYAERAAVVGPEAALRLGQLDQSERDWQSRLNQYASATEEQRTPLLSSLFSEQERLRVAGALELREAQRKNSGR